MAFHDRSVEPRSFLGTHGILGTLVLLLALGCALPHKASREDGVAVGIDELVAELGDPETASRAATELARLGGGALPRLMQLLRTHADPDRTLNYRQYTGICHAAGLMGSTAIPFVPDLVEAWTNGDRVVSQQAASVLLHLFPLLPDDAVERLRAEARTHPVPRWLQRLRWFEVRDQLDACWFDDALRLALGHAGTCSAGWLLRLLDSQPEDALHIYDVRARPLAVAALVARRRATENEASPALRSALEDLRTRALRIAPAHERDESLFTVAGALQRALHVLDLRNSGSPFVHDLESAHAMLRDFDARERRAALAWFRRERPRVAPGLRLDVVRSLWDQDPAVVEDAIATIECWPEAGAVALPSLRSIAESGTGQAFRARCRLALDRCVSAQSERSPAACRTLANFRDAMEGSIVETLSERDDEVVHDVLTGCRFASVATAEAALEFLGPPGDLDDEGLATVAETMANAYGDCVFAYTTYLATDIARTERAFARHGVRMLELGERTCCPWLGTLATELVARTPTALRSERAHRDPLLRTRAALHRAITRLRQCDAMPGRAVWNEVAQLLAVPDCNRWGLDRARRELAALAEIGRAPEVRRNARSLWNLWSEDYEGRMRDLVLVHWADGTGAERLRSLEDLAQRDLMNWPNTLVR